LFLKTIESMLITFYVYVKTKPENSQYLNKKNNQIEPHLQMKCMPLFWNLPSIGDLANSANYVSRGCKQTPF